MKKNNSKIKRTLSILCVMIMLCTLISGATGIRASDISFPEESFTSEEPDNTSDLQDTDASDGTVFYDGESISTYIDSNNGNQNPDQENTDSNIDADQTQDTDEEKSDIDNTYNPHIIGITDGKQSVKVKTETADLYAEASAESEVIASVPQDTTLELTGISEDNLWYRVLYDKILYNALYNKEETPENQTGQTDQTVQTGQTDQTGQVTAYISADDVILVYEEVIDNGEPTETDEADKYDQTETGQYQIADSNLEISHQKYIRKNDSGNYDLTLNVAGSIETQITRAQADVLLIVDVSGSMAYDDNGQTTADSSKQKLTKLKNAVSGLVDSFDSKDIDAQYNLVTFASQAANQNNGNWMGGSALKAQMNSLSANGGTNYEQAFRKVAAPLSTARSNASKIVIFLTDGQPTQHGTSASANSNSNNYDRDGLGDATDETTLNTALESAKNIKCDKFYAVGFNLPSAISKGQYGHAQRGETSADGKVYGKKTIRSGRYTTTYWGYNDTVNVNNNSVENSNISGLDILSWVTDNVTAPSEKQALNLSGTDKLSELFSSIVNSSLSFACSNVMITDTLSDYVQTTSASALNIRVMQKTADTSGQETYTEIGSITGTAGGEEDTLPETTLNVDGMALTAGYNSSTKTVTLDFPDEYTLKEGYYYYVTITNLAPTEMAYSEYSSSGYNAVGDQFTDAGSDSNYAVNNGTSSEQAGFYSNREAKVSYTYKNSSKSADYAKPVVQVAGYDIVKSKTAKLADWNERTYDITLNASSSPAANADIKDYIDERFELTEAEAARLRKDGAEVGTEQVSDRTLWYVKWSDQRIAEVTTDSSAKEIPGWTKTFRIKAKDSFIGDNAVTTNGSGSGITVNGQFNEFERPAVNVRAQLDIADKEVTIYKGDTVPTEDSILAQLLAQTETSYSKGTIGNDETVQSLIESGNITIQWYKDQDCTEPVTVEEMGREKPDSDTEYYLKAAYKAPTAPTSESNANTTGDGVTYITGNDDNDGKDDQTVEAFGIYKIHVISGAIDISKTVTEKDGKTPLKVTDDLTFRFKVTRWQTNKDGTLQTDDEGNKAADTSFSKDGWKDGSTTVSVTVKQGESEGTLTDDAGELLKDLPRGTYTAEEIDVPEGYTVSDAAVTIKDGDNGGTDCRYSVSEDHKYITTFKLGYKNDSSSTDTDVISKARNENGQPMDYIYDPENGGVKGLVTYTNKQVIIYNPLPGTGGPGIYGFTISSAAFIVAALLLFINNKRKEGKIAGRS